MGMIGIVAIYTIKWSAWCTRYNVPCVYREPNITLPFRHLCDSLNTIRTNKHDVSLCTHTHTLNHSYTIIMDIWREFALIVRHTQNEYVDCFAAVVWLICTYAHAAKIFAVDSIYVYGQVNQIRRLALCCCFIFYMFCMLCVGTCRKNTRSHTHTHVCNVRTHRRTTKSSLLGCGVESDQCGQCVMVPQTRRSLLLCSLVDQDRAVESLIQI